MPELPDLEVLKENILNKFSGQEVAGIVARNDESDLEKTLVGTKLIGITRRGKYLILAWGQSPTDIKAELVMHLMLHGRLTSVKTGTPAKGTLVLAINFANGEELRLDDRTFWSKHWLGVDGHLDKLGVEPDRPDFTLEYFADKLSRSRGKIKPLLMKQEFIAGLGNAYTDEALFKAGVHPEQPAKSLDEVKVKELYQAIKDVLPWGISEIRKVVGTDIREDEERIFMSVYRKANEPCPVCQTKIVETKVGGRDTFYCPLCQKFIDN